MHKEFFYIFLHLIQRGENPDLPVSRLTKDNL